MSTWKPATFDDEKALRFDGNHLERKHREEGITNLDGRRRCHPSGDEDDTIGGQGRRGGKGRGEDDD